jgi:hypothetical protein
MDMLARNKYRYLICFLVMQVFIIAWAVSSAAYDVAFYSLMSAVVISVIALAQRRRESLKF